MAKKNEQNLAAFGMADKVENWSYMRKFTPVEMQEMKDNLVNKQITLSIKDAELKAINQSFKDEMKPLKEQSSALIINLKNKAESVTESCGVEFDYVRMIGIITNSDGEIVGQRALTEDEMQMTTMSVLRKNGTNN